MDVTETSTRAAPRRRAAAGKVLGALGLLLLLSSPYTLWVSSGKAWVAAVKAALGLCGIAVYLVTHAGELAEPSARRSRFFVLSDTVLVLALVLALGAGNLIAARRNHTWDLTQRKIFTLSAQTTSVLKGLPEPVRALSFILTTSPSYESSYELLSRYHREAPDRFDFSFRDPRRFPELAAKYQLREGQTTIVLTRGEGPREVHAAINLATGQELTEQNLTNALAKLTSVGEQHVYVLTGHGEWPLEGSGEDDQNISEFGRSLLQEGYLPAPLNLAGKSEVPRDAALVIIPGARTPLTSAEEHVLRAYLEQGGHLLLFVEAEADVGLKALLAAYGIEVDPGMVADDQYNAEGPYVIVTNFYSEHELGRTFKRLQLNLQLPTVRGLTVLREGLLEGVRAEPVVLSSPNAWEQTALTSQPTRDQGAKSGSIPLVVASSRRIEDAGGRRSAEARLVVFGDSELLVDANWRRESYRNLVLNAAAWTTLQLDKITIRPVDRDLSTLDLDDATMGKIRFLATDVLPLGLLGVGLAIWMGRRSR